MNTDRMTLAEFLRVRLDEDERAAREAVPSKLERQPEPYEPWYANEAESSGDTIVAMHPTRALAEVEAKRGILHRLETHARALDVAAPIGDAGYRLASGYRHSEDAIIALFLALPYTGHPDYDEAWRP
jgi:hypothetical protein